MGIDRIGFNLKPGESDLAFAGPMKTFSDDPKARGPIADRHRTRQN